MRKTSITCLLFLLLFCTGCDRDKRSITGDYSYKISGEVELTDADGGVSYRLIHRNGQMHILKDKSQKSKYILTLNEMNGGCYTVPATLHGDSLILEMHTFNTNILSSNGLPDFDQEDNPSLVYRVTASGGGVINGDMLMLTERWDGHQSGNPHATLKGMEMNIIAEKN